MATAAMLAAASCGGEGTTTPAARATTALVVVSGDRQTGAAGSVLGTPIVMKTQDAEDRPVPGAIVTFTVTGGNGSVSVGLDTSDAAGSVATSWTLGTQAGQAQQLTATVVSETNATVSPATVTASVTAAAPAGLDVNPPGLTAPLGQALPTLSVTVRDRFGNRAPVAGLSITARLGDTTSASIVTPPSATTDTSGATLVGVTVTGRAGAASLIVESPGLIAGQVALTLTAGKAQRLDVTGNASITAVAGASGPALSVRVSDSWGNPVAGVVVAFAVDSVGPIGQATTTPDGVATLSTWTAPAIGTYRIIATSAGVAATAQIALSTLRGPPTVLTPLSSNPTSGIVGTTVVLAVRATDASGAIAPGVALGWSSGAYSGIAVTDQFGVAQFSVILGTKVGSAQVVVTAGSTASATLNVQQLPGGLAPFATVDTLTIAAGGQVTFIRTALDRYNNLIPGLVLYAVSDVTGEPMTLVATTNANGTATFTANLDPYAATISFVFELAPSSDPYGSTVVFATAPRGVVRLPGPDRCPKLNSLGLLDSWTYGPDGHAASGVKITWIPQAGSGSVFTGVGTLTFLPSLTTVSRALGWSTVGWMPPAAAGTYTLTAIPQAGYDAVSPLLYTCDIR